jgi:hypothetical protein
MPSTHKPKPNDVLDAEPKTKHRPGCRFNKAERRAIMLECFGLYKRFVEASAIVDYVMKTYGVHRSQAYRYLAEARRYSMAKWSMSTKQLKADLASFVSAVMTSPDATNDHKLAAVRELSKLFGLYAPEKSVVANVEAGDVDPAAAGDLLQKMHRDLLDNPEAMEHAHRLYEALGAKDAGVPALPLEDRMARNQAEGAALLEEYKARGNGNGHGNGARPRPGLTEWPPPQTDLPRQEDYGHGEPEPGGEEG